MADPDRITVSVETLRGELAQLELRIVDRLGAALAQKADLLHMEQLEARVQSLELSRASREAMAATVADNTARLTRLERFRYAFPGVAVLAFALSLLLTLVAVLQHFNV